MEAQKVLLTTDLSDEALRPFESVATLAKKLGMTVHLLHVVEDLTVAPHGAPLAPSLHSPSLAHEMERARGILEEQKASLGHQVEVSTDVTSSDDVAGAIADYAARHHCDLIALSTHGRSGFRRMVMGSVAEKVLRHAKVPVIVFPRQE